MKIIITASTLPTSAIDTVPAFVREQAIELKNNYPDLDILLHSPHNSYSDTANAKEDNEHYRVHRYHYFWPFSWELLVGRGIIPALRKNKLLYLQIPFLVTFQFLSLLFLVRREKPKLIYAHWFTPQAISASLVSRITGIPFLFTTHASDVTVLRKFPFSKSIVSWVCRCSSAYIAVSERTAEKLKSFFSDHEWHAEYKNKLSIIPMGVATQLPKIVNQNHEDIKSRFGIPLDKSYMLFLGRLAEKKGVAYLLEADSQIPVEMKQQLHLIIAGDGQLKAGLKDYSDQLALDNVTFTGYVTGSTKEALINFADYACFPSIIDDTGDSEGFPVSIMECLAAGKLVLSSNVTGAEDVIQQNSAGLVFREKSANELAQSIVDALSLSDQEKELIRGNSRSLASQYDWKIISDQHHNIFIKCLNNDL